MSRVSRVVLTLSTAAILVATLRPDLSRGAQAWASCILCGGRGTADALVNLILFAPLGVGLALAGVRARRATLMGALLSALIELAQTAIPGRDPSLGDVLFNTLGTVAGVTAVLLAPRALSLPAPRAARLSLAAAGAFAGAVALTGALLQPSYPHSRYFAQWTPHLGHLEWYSGHVRSSRIGTLLLLPPGRVANSDSVRSLLVGSAPITVFAIAGPPPPGLSSLFSIYDQHQREIMLLGPDHHDLVYRYRTGGAFLGFDQPSVRLRGALRGVRPGDSLQVTISSPKRGRFCLGQDRDLTCDLGFSAGDGWALLYYAESFPAWLERLLRAIWLASLVAPVGFWMRRRAESAAALVLLGVGLWLLPDLVGLKPPGLGLSLTTVGALAVAAWAGNRWSRRARSVLPR